MSLLEIHFVKLRVVKIIKHSVSRSGFHGRTRRKRLKLQYPVYFALLKAVVAPGFRLNTVVLKEKGMEKNYLSGLPSVIKFKE